MPQMANVIVKKNDGTTDVVYTSLVPSAGDKTPAIWKNQTIGSASSHRPELKLTSRDNGTMSARRVEGTFTYPTLATDVQGKVNAVDRVILNVNVVVPKGMPDVDVNEAISQGFNLFASSLLKDSCKTGYAPT